MSEFETSASITVTLDSGSLRDARSTLEDELSSDPITVSADGGSTAMTDGGQRAGGGLSSLRDSAESLTTLADDRNTILSEMLEAVESQAFETAQQGGGGGGGGLLPAGLAGLLGGGGAGGILSNLGGLLGKAPKVGGGGSLGIPAVGPEISKQLDKLSETLGGDGILPDGLGEFGKGGGGAPSGTETTMMMANPDLMNKALNFEWPEPPALPEFSWPDVPDLPEFSWPDVPDPFAGLSWPEAPDPLAGLDWPNPPDPLSGIDWPDPPDPLAEIDWPDPPNPFAQMDWPDPPDPLSGLDWPDPPDPFAGFSWPEPPDLEANLNVDIQNLGQNVQREVEDWLRNEFQRGR